MYGDMLCTMGDQRRLFMFLLYAGMVLCLVEILGLLEVFGFLQPRSFLLEGWERPWSDGSGLVPLQGRERKRDPENEDKLPCCALLA